MSNATTIPPTAPTAPATESSPEVIKRVLAAASFFALRDHRDKTFRTDLQLHRDILKHTSRRASEVAPGLRLEASRRYYRALLDLREMPADQQATAALFAAGSAAPPAGLNRRDASDHMYRLYWVMHAMGMDVNRIMGREIFVTINLEPDANAIMGREVFATATPEPPALIEMPVQRASIDLSDFDVTPADDARVDA